VNFTRSHTKYRLVKKKKLLSVGMTHQNLSRTECFGPNVLLLLVGERAEQ
jgi:hypothetical protein